MKIKYSFTLPVCELCRMLVRVVEDGICPTCWHNLAYMQAMDELRSRPVIH